MISCCSNVEQLKEKRVDFTVQHHIALDLLYQIRLTGKFTCNQQCVLNAVQLVALTISNLQRLEVILSQTEAVNNSEVDQLHNTVKNHVLDLWRLVMQWLTSALSVLFGDVHFRELEVSTQLLQR